ncbi:myeloid leukemia factor 1 isoform X6 [Rhinoderma darwinii]|uniref:myeloid leukemia factor 1 isoform X6 n=1 Tax=Rhinoderma darwinii TaxID=43563 RepID=UPI003F67AD49
MFGSLLRDFEEDPFFSDPFTAHQEHVRQMMRSFSDPFGRDPFFSITDGRSHGRRGQQGSQVALREDHREGLADKPDVHSFKSSSVMTYSKTGDEPPKIFHASSQTRKAPGGIKETKEAVKDSESGVEQIAVGHHIKDRAHIVKQLKNNKTGDEELNQEFLNMDESDAPSFDSEWDREISKFKPYEKKFSIEAPKHQKAQYSTKIRPPGVPRRERCISKMVI